MVLTLHQFRPFLLLLLLWLLLVIIHTFLFVLSLHEFTIITQHNMN